MVLTFVDASVLIAAFCGIGAVAARAMEVLDDPNRVFASSVFVRLELLPKARYHRQTAEVEFYEAFFDAVAQWAEPLEQMVADAIDEASRTGLAAMDALHVAAAAAVGAAELVTAESTTKPLYRTTRVVVRSIRPPAAPTRP